MGETVLVAAKSCSPQAKGLPASHCPDPRSFAGRALFPNQAQMAISLPSGR